MTKSQKITYYILLVLISAGFIMAAYPKLMSDPMSIEGFKMAHLPMWFMYFIGTAELAGAIGLWIRPLARYAALGLSIILIGAFVVTVIYSNPLEALVPVLFGVILFFVNKLGKKRSYGAVAEQPIV